jgi:thiamine biosynthesis lipoprotein
MPAQFSFEAIGTSWKIDIFDEVSPEASSLLLKKIQDRVELFEQTYSRFRDTSLISQISQKAGEYILPDDAKLLFDTYKKFYDLTGGMLTPLIGSLMEETGYDAKYSLVSRELHHPLRWEDVLDYDFPRLSVKKPVSLDFGALGKGYCIDIVGDILKTEGIESFCVDAGSDILCQQNAGEALQIGLENPNDFSEVIGVAEIKNQSICGSSGSRRKWGDFHHIMHPFALKSVDAVLATWAIAPTALLSDALASALFFMPGTFLRNNFDFEYIVLYPDFSVDVSSGFKGEVF